MRRRPLGNVAVTTCWRPYGRGVSEVDPARERPLFISRTRASGGCECVLTEACVPVPDPRVGGSALGMYAFDSDPRHAVGQPKVELDPNVGQA